MKSIAQDARRSNSPRAGDDNVESILISEWPLSRGEIARVSIKFYKGIWLLDIRKFFEGGGGEYNPGNKGISLSIKHLKRINVAVADALAVALERGFIATGEEGEQ